MAKSDIFTQLSNSLRHASTETKVNDSGKVLTYSDGIALADGLKQVAMGELVEIGHKGLTALALNLSTNHTGLVLLQEGKAKQGDIVTSTGRLMSIPVSDELIGKVVDVLGNPIDGSKPIQTDKFYPLERIAPGVMTRKSVDTPLQTGIKAIDGMIPIGRGQRELIIGDKSTGKSSIALTTIINQSDVICVYVAIGQKRSYISQTIALLRQTKAMDHTIIVAASASDPAAQQYIAPYAGTAIAEYFLDQGKDVLIVYDDLTKHAWAYREISLLLRRPSGREAYPGDVFYLHSRLLERSCRLNKENGGGSITALPIIETQANDVSAYIPTNVISITDGQIYLEADLFNAGQRPAVNVGLSVSRVGSAAQVKSMKQVAGKLRLELAQYRSLAAFAQFSSDLDKKTQSQIDRGSRVTELLKQHWERPMSVPDQVIVLWAATNGLLDQLKIESIKDWEVGVIEHIKNNHSLLYKSVSSNDKLDDETVGNLRQAISQFNQNYPDWLEEIKE